MILPIIFIAYVVMQVISYKFAGEVNPDNENF